MHPFHRLDLLDIAPAPLSSTNASDFGSGPHPNHSHNFSVRIRILLMPQVRASLEDIGSVPPARLVKGVGLVLESLEFCPELILLLVNINLYL